MGPARRGDGSILEGRRRARAALTLAAAAAGLLGLGLPPVLGQTPHPAAAMRARTWEEKAPPMQAWSLFCRRLPGECRVDFSEPETISLTSDLWAQVIAVNREVNAAIRAVPDQAHWGVEDRWDYPDDGIGDCEDIQLLKRKLLTARGLPRRAMRMTVVIDETGAGHAVLMLRTDRGDFILDNKRDAVLPWDQTGYTFVKREGSGRLAWVWITPRTSPVVTANR